MDNSYYNSGASEREEYFSQYFNLRKRKLDFQKDKKKSKVLERKSTYKKLKELLKGESDDIRAISESISKNVDNNKNYNLSRIITSANYEFDGADSEEDMAAGARETLERVRQRRALTEAGARETIGRAKERGALTGAEARGTRGLKVGTAKDVTKDVGKILMGQDVGQAIKNILARQFLLGLLSAVVSAITTVITTIGPWAALILIIAAAALAIMEQLNLV